MKKTIKVPTEKMITLQETKDGTLQGGFASIKGGFNSSLDDTNQFDCTNATHCDHTTNSNLCTNLRECFM